MGRATTNPELLETIRFLKVQAKKNKSKIWKVAAEHLSRPRAARAVLNLNHISRAVAADSSVIVPGKVLGDGVLKHPVVVGAFQFSQTARVKIERAGGKCVGIKDLVAMHPDGANVRILR